MGMLAQMVLAKTNAAVLLKSLDAAMLRTRVIANNIANVNTPGYRRMTVSFEEHLRAALDRTALKGAQTDSRHLPLGRLDISKVNPVVERPVDPSLPSGVNNVDIDAEMARLAEAQLMYNYGVKFTKNIYTKLNSAAQARSMPTQ